VGDIGKLLSFGHSNSGRSQEEVYIAFVIHSECE